MRSFLEYSYLKQLSIEMGYGGVIDDDVINEALDEEKSPEEERMYKARPEDDEHTCDVNECKGCGSNFQTEDPKVEYCARCSTYLYE